MAKSNLDQVGSLIYNGMTPPKEFTKVFRLQSLFLEWDATAQAKNIPVFLEKRALEVYTEITDKTNIENVLTALESHCGPTKEQYMAMFYARKRNPGETALKYGKALEELLKQGMPDIKGEAMNSLLKMQLNSQSLKPFVP
jgi:hypothetical protein